MRRLAHDWLRGTPARHAAYPLSPHHRHGHSGLLPACIRHTPREPRVGTKSATRPMASTTTFAWPPTVAASGSSLASPIPAPKPGVPSSRFYAKASSSPFLSGTFAVVLDGTSGTKQPTHSTFCLTKDLGSFLLLPLGCVRAFDQFCLRLTPGIDGQCK
jgi:hypothetical protein